MLASHRKKIVKAANHIFINDPTGSLSVKEAVFKACLSFPSIIDLYKASDVIKVINSIVEKMVEEGM